MACTLYIDDYGRISTWENCVRVALESTGDISIFYNNGSDNEGYNYSKGYVYYNGSEISEGWSWRDDDTTSEITLTISDKIEKPTNPTTPPGGDSGDRDPEGTTPTPGPVTIPFSFTVKSYKEGTVTEVNSDFYVEECYYLERYDENTVGDYGLLNLKYYTGYDSYENVYTGEQTHTVPSTITGYKLSGFHGIENGQSLVGERNGINNYTFEAYYIVNSFTVTINAEGIDGSQVTVQNPNTTSIKYNLPYTNYYPNTTLLLEAITTNEEYKFVYWKVNGTKIYKDILRCEITENLVIYCCFEEKMTVDNVEDDKIATNSDIHTIMENSSLLYPINDDESSDYLNYRCPTKYDILNNTIENLSTNAGQLINIGGTYTNDQCVKFEDISFNPRKIKIRLYNDATSGVNNLGSTIVTFYASENTLDSISAGDTELISINIDNYTAQTGGNFDKGVSINVEYTLPNYNIFNMHIKIKIRGKYGSQRAFKTYCKNSSTISWMDQTNNALPGGSVFKDTVKGYSRKYNYFIKINNSADPNLCVVFYE